MSCSICKTQPASYVAEDARLTRLCEKVECLNILIGPKYKLDDPEEKETKKTQPSASSSSLLDPMENLITPAELFSNNLFSFPSRMEIIGPVHMVYMLHPETKHKVLLFGEIHKNRLTEADWFCSPSAYAARIEYLLALLFQRRGQQFDFFLEMAPRSLLSTRYNMMPNETLYDIRDHFVDCFLADTDACRFPNVRFHTSDYRQEQGDNQVLYYPSHEEDSRTTVNNLIGHVKRHGGYDGYMEKIRQHRTIQKQYQKVMNSSSSPARRGMAEAAKRAYDELYEMIKRELRYAQAPDIFSGRRSVRELHEKTTNDIKRLFQDIAVLFVEEYTTLRMMKEYTLDSFVITYTGDQHSQFQMYVLKTMGYQLIQEWGLDSRLLMENPRSMFSEGSKFIKYMSLMSQPQQCIRVDNPFTTQPFSFLLLPNTMKKSTGLFAAMLQSPDKAKFGDKRRGDELSLLRLFWEDSHDGLVATRRGDDLEIIKQQATYVYTGWFQRFGAFLATNKDVEKKLASILLTH